MKKLITILLVLFMLVFVVACEDDPVNTNTDPITTNSDTETDTSSDTDTDDGTDTDTDYGTDTDTDSDIESGSNGEDQNDILGPGWTSPNK